MIADISGMNLILLNWIVKHNREATREKMEAPRE